MLAIYCSKWIIANRQEINVYYKTLLSEQHNIGLNIGMTMLHDTPGYTTCTNIAPYHMGNDYYNEHMIHE